MVEQVLQISHLAALIALFEKTKQFIILKTKQSQKNIFISLSEPKNTNAS